MLLVYVLFMVFLMTSETTADAVCPQASAIAPCVCVTHLRVCSYRVCAYGAQGDPNGIAIDCSKQNLMDKDMPRIFNALLAPGISPVIELYAGSNMLTTIPKQLSNLTSTQFIDVSFNQITSLPSGSFNNPSKSFTINLSSNQISSITSASFNFPMATYVYIQLNQNKITSIPLGLIKSFAAQAFIDINFGSNNISSISSGSFNYAQAKTVNLDFSLNAIKTIEPGSFQGVITYINLESNKLATLDSKVFLSLMSNMNNPDISLLNAANNPIDCSANLCSLSWLNRDNPKLLTYLKSGTCSNGTDIAKLNPSGFTGCPTNPTIPTTKPTPTTTPAKPTTTPAKKTTTSAQKTTTPAKKTTTPVKPTVKPTTKPTAKPTTKPTAKPTTKPTAKPTTKPTAKPTTKPTAKPTTKKVGRK